MDDTLVALMDRCLERPTGTTPVLGDFIAEGGERAIAALQDAWFDEGLSVKRRALALKGLSLVPPRRLFTDTEALLDRPADAWLRDRAVRVLAACLRPLLDPRREPAALLAWFDEAFGSVGHPLYLMSRLGLDAQVELLSEHAVARRYVGGDLPLVFEAPATSEATWALDRLLDRLLWALEWPGAETMAERAYEPLHRAREARTRIRVEVGPHPLVRIIAVGAGYEATIGPKPPIV